MEQIRRIRDRAEIQTCPCCGKGKLIKQITGFFLEIESPIFLEHVSPEGKLFKNKKEIRQYCKENNLQSGALL